MTHPPIRSGIVSLPYLYGLDAIRFCAALLVAFRHLSQSYPAFVSIGWGGWIGVEIFFVISGLVIANSAASENAAKFLTGRVMRLFPAALLCSVLNWLAILVFSPNGHLNLVSLACSVFIVPGCPFIAAAYWTLPVEIVFYAFVFFLLVGGHFNRLPALAGILAITSGAFVLALAASRFVFIQPNVLEFGFGIANVTLLRHGVFFALGIYLWLWSQGRLEQKHVLPASIAFTFGILEIICRSAQQIDIAGVPLNQPRETAAVAGIWALSIAAMIGSIYGRDRIAALNPVLLRIFRQIGLATYPLYLMHQDIGMPLARYIFRAGVPAWGVIVTALVILTMSAIVVCEIGEPFVRSRIREAVARSSIGLLQRITRLLPRRAGAIPAIREE